MNVMAIFGPPGTGKTRQLVDFAEKEGQGLFLSYTRAAAAEAVSRIKGKVRASTIHSQAFSALNMNRSAVVDRPKLQAFGKETGIPFKGGEEGVVEEQEGDEYMTVLSFARNAECALSTAYDQFGCPGTMDRFTQFVTQYADWKKTYGYMDFDDMLVKYVDNCKPYARTVFLDEAQDCTPLQWVAIRHACGAARQVYIAGDDDQAIYEWNGADPHGMIKFMNDFKGEMIVLGQSHRLPKVVHQLALSVIGMVGDRVQKTFHHTGQTGLLEKYRDNELIVDQIAKIVPEGGLFLMRDRFKVEETKRALNRELIPYDVYGGYSPWTGKIATALRNGDKIDVPMAWREFYEVADLNAPILYHLSTIHSAKGRESDTVILDLDCPPRVLLNFEREPDAERRVQYVGLTRARKRLILCGDNPVVSS